MINKQLLTSKEKKLFCLVGIVVTLFIVDFAVRSWQGALAGLHTQEAQLNKDWAYTSAILGRSASIEAKYKAIHSTYSKFFDETNDSSRVMAELDEVAKFAGLQVNMIRPVQRGADKSMQFELAFKGTWVQIMGFFQNAEDSTHYFEFPSVRIHRIEPSGELEVSVTAMRKIYI